MMAKYKRMNKITSMERSSQNLVVIIQELVPLIVSAIHQNKRSEENLAIRHEIILSTTEPNNETGLIKVRQADEATQKLIVQISENGARKPYAGLQAFFC